MISPHTAPETKVVFLRDPVCIASNKVVAPFRKGDHAEVADIFPENLLPSGYAAYISESNGFYCLSLLRLAALPDCLIEAQHSQPLVPDSEKQRANADARDREHLRQFLPFD